MGRGEQKKEAKVEKERKNVVGSSTQMLADVEQNVSFKTRRRWFSEEASTGGSR